MTRIYGIKRLKWSFVLLLIISSLSLFSNPILLPKKKNIHLSYIPKESSFVASMNLVVLFQKSQIELKGAIKDSVDAIMSNGGASAKEAFYKTIAKGSWENGVDFRMPVTVFISELLENSNAVLLKLSSERQFSKMFKRLIKDGYSIQIVEKEDYKEVVFDDIVLVYNKEAAIIVDPEFAFWDCQSDVEVDFDEKANSKNLKQKILTSLQSLMSEQRSTSILDNTHYQKMMQCKGDITLFVAHELFKDLKLLEIKKFKDLYALLALDKLVPGVATIAALNMNKGEVSLEYAAHSENKKFDAMMTQFYHAFPHINNGFLSRYPLNTVGIYSMNLNGRKMLKIDPIKNIVLKHLNFIEYAIYKKLTSALNGDITLALINSEGKDMEFMAYVTIENKALFNDLLSFRKIAYFIKNEGNDLYSVQLNGIQLFFRIQDHLLKVANNKELLSESVEKNEKSLQKMKSDLSITDYSSYCYINIDELLKLKFMQEKMTPEIQKVISQFTKIEMGSSAKNASGKMVLYLRDKKQNSLKIISEELMECINMILIKEKY